MSDRNSIKNLIFTKQVESYQIPVPTEGRKVYPCNSCGDKYLFESSLDYHLERKSVCIFYFCKPCKKMINFFNRCKLLSHIRTHISKTTKQVQLSDLKVDVLPFSAFNLSKPEIDSIIGKINASAITCNECKMQIDDVVSHYNTRISSLKFVCVICRYTLNTKCALEAHVRIHKQMDPLICPECGKKLNMHETSLPYTNHKCGGFIKMAVATRMMCPVSDCGNMHPSEFIKHVLHKHQKALFKCNRCTIACYNAKDIMSHINETHGKYEGNKRDYTKFFQCQLCPGRLVLEIHQVIHAMSHSKSMKPVYPCWNCGMAYNTVTGLLMHSEDCNDTVSSEVVHVPYTSTDAESSSVVATIQENNSKHDQLFRVVKRCSKCHISVVYRCKASEIEKLPTLCPLMCAQSTPEKIVQPPETLFVLEKEELPLMNADIICGMCKLSTSSKLESMKKHFDTYHKEHKFLDLRVNLTRMKKPEIRAIIQRGKRKAKQRAKRNKSRKIRPKPEKLINPLLRVASRSDFVCQKCDEAFVDKESLRSHFSIHRDLLTAYQCMECGLCFVVKPSFSIHLKLAHDIQDVEDYIEKNGCYNEQAMKWHQFDNDISSQPLKKGQCEICREQFPSSEALDKHFRTHGMAFLMTQKIDKNGKQLEV